MQGVLGMMCLCGNTLGFPDCLRESSQRAHGDGAELGGSAPQRPVQRFAALELHLAAIPRRGLSPSGEVCGWAGAQHTLPCSVADSPGSSLQDSHCT